MPCWNLRRLGGVVAAATLVVLLGAVPGTAAPPATPVPAVSAQPVSHQPRPGRGVTGLLAVVASVCVAGVTTAAIRAIYSYRSISTRRP
jgi:hypothetical protein